MSKLSYFNYLQMPKKRKGGLVFSQCKPSTYYSKRKRLESLDVTTNEAMGIKQRISLETVKGSTDQFIFHYEDFSTDEADDSGSCASTVAYGDADDSEYEDEHDAVAEMSTAHATVNNTTSECQSDTDKDCQTDLSCYCEQISKWASEQGEDDFLSNFASAIQGPLAKGNIAFQLFSELLRFLTSPRNFEYKETTLLWWITGMKQYGAKFLRNMKGIPSVINFAAPAPCTLSKRFPKAIGNARKRKPGMYCYMIF